MLHLILLRWQDLFFTEMTPLKMVQMKSIRKANRKLIYVYKDNVLIYKANSQGQLIDESGLSNTSVAKGLSGNLIFSVLTLSPIILANSKSSIVDFISFKRTVDTLRLLFQKNSLSLQYLVDDNNTLIVSKLE